MERRSMIFRVKNKKRGEIDIHISMITFFEKITKKKNS